MTEHLQHGAALCQRFYEQAVRPILDAHFPGLTHAAALIDSGSEVLGFDDEQSTDHHWGPRALLFLSEADHARYAPYSKWFGTAFKQLAAADELAPTLWLALQAATWPAREAALVLAYEALARQHNALGLTAPLPEQVRDFFGRPFRVMALHGFAEALLAEVRDPAVQRLAQRPIIGSLDLFSDSTDLTARPEWRPALRGLYP